MAENVIQMMTDEYDAQRFDGADNTAAMREAVRVLAKHMYSRGRVFTAQYLRKVADGRA